MGSVVSECGDTRTHFVDDVDRLSAGSKGKMPRTRARRDFGEGWLARLEGASGGVKAVDEQLIQPQIGRKDKTVVGRHLNRVRVRTLLALRISAGTVVLDPGRGRAQTAVWQDWEFGNASAVVICHQNKLPGLIERDKARAGAPGGDLVQQSELPGFSIDGEGTHGAGVSALKVVRLIDGVKVSAMRSRDEKGRIAGFRRKAERCQSARARIETIYVNALAVRLCVRADVNQEFGFVHFRASMNRWNQVRHNDACY